MQEGKGEILWHFYAVSHNSSAWACGLKDLTERVLWCVCEEVQSHVEQINADEEMCKS